MNAALSSQTNDRPSGSQEPFIPAGIPNFAKSATPSGMPSNLPSFMTQARKLDTQTSEVKTEDLPKIQPTTEKPSEPVSNIVPLENKTVEIEDKFNAFKDLQKRLKAEKESKPLEDTSVTPKSEAENKSVEDAEETKEPVVEDKPKKRGRPAKNKQESTPEPVTKVPAASKPETTPSESSLENKELEALSILEKVTDFKEMEANVLYRFIDDEWESFKEEIALLNSQITIPHDANHDHIKVVGENLVTLRDKVLVHYLMYKTNYQALVGDKTKGILDCQMILKAHGSNEAERKRNAIIGCMNYETEEGKRVNLFELVEGTKERYLFLQGILDSIAFKSGLLITMNSANLQEQKVLGCH